VWPGEDGAERGMGSRDAVKAASEIGVIMNERSVQNTPTACLHEEGRCGPPPGP
jgi:hypothetical protein